MALNTGQYTAIQRDITITISQAAAAATPMYPSLCTLVRSRRADEKYAWIGNLPGMRKWLGDRRFEQLRSADYLLANEHWESSLSIPRTTLDDDVMGLLRPALSELGVEAGYHPDELLFEAMRRGSLETCFDGQFFYDTDHLWGDSGTQSNKLTYDVTTPASPTPEEFRAAVAQAVLAMLGFKNDRGKAFIRPAIRRTGGTGAISSLMLTVPLALFEVADKAFEQSVVIETSGSNIAATSNHVLAKPEVVAVHDLGASNPDGSDVRFNLHYTGGPLRPFVFQRRENLRVQTKGSNDIEFNEIKAMTEARYAVGHLAWWNSVETTLT